MQYYKIEKDSQKLRGKVHKENGPQGRLAPALPGHALLFFFFLSFSLPSRRQNAPFPALCPPGAPLRSAPCLPAPAFLSPLPERRTFFPS